MNTFFSSIKTGIGWLVPLLVLALMSCSNDEPSDKQAAAMPEAPPVVEQVSIAEKVDKPKQEPEPAVEEEEPAPVEQEQVIEDVPSPSTVADVSMPAPEETAESERKPMQETSETNTELLNTSAFIDGLVEKGWRSKTFSDGTTIMFPPQDQQ